MEFVCKNYGQSKFVVKNCQKLTKLSKSDSFWTGLVEHGQPDLDTDLTFLEFFSFCSSSFWLTHGLWQQHGWNWKEWTKLNVMAAADADTNSTMQTEKTMQRLGWVMGQGDLNPISIFGFFMVYRYVHRCNLDYENSKSHRATWNLIPLDRAKVSDLLMRYWYVDLVGGVRAWRSNYTCEARAPMQSLGQSPEIPILWMQAWPVRVLIPTWNREQVRTNIAIKILWMKYVCFIQKVGFQISGLLLGDWPQKSSS
jgi:hypothetical protein